MSLRPYEELAVLSGFYFLSASEIRRITVAVNPEDETSVKWAIATFVAPRIKEIEAKWPGNTERLRAALDGLLTSGVVPDEGVFYAEEPPFEHPRELLNYYRWAWDVLFKDTAG